MDPLELAIDEVKKNVLKKLEEAQRNRQMLEARTNALKKFQARLVEKLKNAVSQLCSVTITETYGEVKIGKHRIIVGYFQYKDGTSYECLGFLFDDLKWRADELDEGLKNFLLKVFRLEIELLAQERLEASLIDGYKLPTPPQARENHPRPIE